MFRAVGLCVCVFVLVEPVAVRAGSPDAGDQPDAIRELQERIRVVLDRYEVPGVGLALVSRERVVWAGGVGKANLATGTAVEATTVFRVGSITKTVIALAVLKLAQDGRIALNTPVRSLAPEIAVGNPWAATHPVTVAQLLEHTAGFDDMHFNEMFAPAERADLPLREVLAINPRSRVSRWVPGSRHAYANPCYTLAGYLIEKVTGEPFEHYVEREILHPIGMASASFRRTPTIRARLAQGYTGPDNRVVPFAHIYHRPAGELMASPQELAQLVKLLLRRGRGERGPLLPATAIARMERSETRPYPVSAAAYGLGNYGDVSLAVPTYGHNGGLPGFLSEFRYAPDRGVGYVMLLNSMSSNAMAAFMAIRSLLLDELLRGQEIPPPPGIEVPPAELARYVGYYEFKSPRQQLFGFLDRLFLGAEVFVAVGTLHMEFGANMRVPLTPTAEGRFRLHGHSEAAIRFHTRADGAQILLVGDAYYEPGSAWLAAARRHMLRMSLCLMGSSMVVFLLWIPGWLRTRPRCLTVLSYRGLPALAALAFWVLPVVFAIGLQRDALGQCSLISGAFFCLSILFAALSVCALGRAILGLGATYPRWSKIYLLAVSGACCTMTIYLLLNRIIGLRTWAW